MRKENDLLYLIVGKSAVGKSTIVEAYCEKYNCTQVMSYSTKPSRDEMHPTHTYTTEEEFDALRSSMVAYTEYNGYKYGATKDQLENSKFYVIDFDGIQDLLFNLNGEIPFKVIYIDIQDYDLLKQRFIQRGDSIEEMNKRLMIDNDKLKIQEHFVDCILENTGSIQDSVNKLRFAIIDYDGLGNEEKEKLKAEIAERNVFGNDEK